MLVPLDPVLSSSTTWRSVLAVVLPSVDVGAASLTARLFLPEPPPQVFIPNSCHIILAQGTCKVALHCILVWQDGLIFPIGLMY